MRSSGETRFAILTIALSLPYFIGETYHYAAYVGFGQHFLGYFVDLIAIALMLLGGIASLRYKEKSAAGWLAAAWGFLACLNLRSFGWRYYEMQENGTTGNEPSYVITLLAFTLFLTFGGLIYALFLSRPRNTKNP